ncbi:MAG: type II toxin-antitoxin system Phd/YefM family antitoxin [Burkholderiaceae bacterium]|nr:type II toxin-antitoxin system Phd/YefM family antitoxin [Burkholderiaceae bacterium]
MKIINVRELRSDIPRLRDILAKEHELLLVSNGEPVARILPAPKKRHVPSLAAHRSKMPTLEGSIADLVREDRDRR